MEKLVVRGGIPLKGELTVSGSKNASVAIIPAVLLADSPCIIENVPRILDVKLMIDILVSLGADCKWLGENTIRIDATKITEYKAVHKNMSRLRGSYYFIGALLARFGKAEVLMAGGCNLGVRPIDQHLKGFQAMGAYAVEEYDMVTARAENGLKGANVFFDVVSVGATINLMLAACKAEGLTILENCAREPHVVDVANFLNAMGANIKGAGTDVIRIKGVSCIRGGITYSVIPDQIEAGTFMIAAAATAGDVVIKNIISRHQESLTAKLLEMNVGVEEGEDWIRIYSKGDLRASAVKTRPYPGFPTDMQPQITVLLSLANGQSQVSEGVWDSRFQYVDELKRMGADITVAGKMAIVNGKRHFKGTSVCCPDLRAGAALVIAALAAAGETDIHHVQYIDRGYDHIEIKLRHLGADIRREEMAAVRL